MHDFWNDFRATARGLRRAPTFALAAITTLALGVGAAAGVFTVADAILFSPLPYVNPSEIHVLSSDDGDMESGQMFLYLRERLRSFSVIAAQGNSTGWNVVVNGRAEYVKGTPVTQSYFVLHQVDPILGRGLSEVDEQGNTPRAVLLSEDLWLRLFEGNRTVLGTVVQLGGIPHTVVGVIPRSFRSIPAADVWTSLRISPAANAKTLRVLGRLKPGIKTATAITELESWRPSIGRDIKGVTASRINTIRWTPYQQWLARDSKAALNLLTTAVLVLLLAAAINVASLHIVRGLARQREMGIRAAFGAGRWLISRPLLLETTFLVVLGTAAGLAFAALMLRVVEPLLPVSLLDGASTDIDARLFAAALLFVVVSTPLFASVATAFSTAPRRQRSVLLAGWQGTADVRTTWLRRLFVTVEVALAVVVLTSAGLLIRSFSNLRQVNTGFSERNVLVGKMSLQGNSYQNPAQLAPFYDTVLERIKAIPGVTAAAVGSRIPIERGLNLPIDPPRRGIVNTTESVDWAYVTDEYFATLGIDVVAGRIFNKGDQGASEPVAVVNEAFARVFFGRQAVVDEAIHAASGFFGDRPRRIVGVVRSVKGRSGAGWTEAGNAFATAAAPLMYVPASQVPSNVLRTAHGAFPVSWVVHAENVSPTLSIEVENVVRSATTALPFINFQTMDQVIGEDLAVERLLAVIISLFGGIALALAGLGLYGLMSYAATQRTKEIGIRMALGATNRKVLRLFLSEAVGLTVGGIVLGIALDVVVGRTLQSFLFNVAALDPLTLVSVCITLLGAALAAGTVPTAKTLREKPMDGLRVI